MVKVTFQIKQEKASPDYGQFIIEPLEQGYGHTLGTALRRVLLSGLPGAAITLAKVSGMKHQFSSLSGIKEDGVDLLLNLKRIRISYKGDKPVKLTLSAKGKKEVKAGDIKTSGNVKIANPDLIIAHLTDAKSKLDIDLQVEEGVGYSPSEDRKTSTVGLIPLDADFSPVKRVAYKVEETRVGRLTNYDKLSLEIWTDGSIDPDKALKDASQILVDYLENIVSPSSKVQVTEKVGTEKKGDLKISNLSVEELSLPTRVANALVRSGYETVKDIVSAEKSDLSKVRNLGEKSVKIIEAALSEKGFSWGK